jgi:hypothetical protein
MHGLLLALHAGPVVWRPTTYVCMYVCTIAHVLIVHPHLLVWTTSERLLPTLVAYGGSHMSNWSIKWPMTVGLIRYWLTLASVDGVMNCWATCAMASQGEHRSSL